MAASRPSSTRRWGRAPFRPPAGAAAGDYFLSLGRLIPYKRVDLAVRAFNALGLPLVVIGDGRDRAGLERIAGPNVRFLGRVSDEEKQRYLAGCRAFLFPGEEDFGIAPLEAQAAGRPVIAYAAGGALDTVREGVTGEFFREATPESLAEAVRRFDPAALRPGGLRGQRPALRHGRVHGRVAGFRGGPRRVAPPGGAWLAVVTWS